MWRKRDEPTLAREDIDAALATLFDIRLLLYEIRNILREDDDEEGTD